MYIYIYYTHTHTYICMHMSPCSYLVFVSLDFNLT